MSRLLAGRPIRVVFDSLCPNCAQSGGILRTTADAVKSKTAEILGVLDVSGHERTTLLAFVKRRSSVQVRAVAFLDAMNHHGLWLFLCSQSGDPLAASDVSMPPPTGRTPGGSTIT